MEDKMLLVFDIGNSNIVMGAYDGKKLYRHWRISTDRQKTGDEYGMLINELFRFQGMDMNDIDDNNGYLGIAGDNRQQYCYNKKN